MWTYIKLYESYYILNEVYEFHVYTVWIIKNRIVEKIAVSRFDFLFYLNLGFEKKNCYNIYNIVITVIL